MIPVSLSELILMTGGGSYNLQAASNPQSALQQDYPAQSQLEYSSQNLPFDHLTIDQVELNLPVHVFMGAQAMGSQAIASQPIASQPMGAEDERSLHPQHLMILMPSPLVSSATGSIGRLKVSFKVSQDMDSFEREIELF